MITYHVITERLLAQLEPLGFCHIDGQPVSANDEACQAIIDAYTLQHYIAERQAESLAIAKRLRDAAVASVSAGEMAAWPIKRAEAVAWAASGDPAHAPLLAAEAAARGITLAAMMAKVGANATHFAALEAAIGGADGKHRDALAELTTWAAVRDYDLTAGWPAL